MINLDWVHNSANGFATGQVKLEAGPHTIHVPYFQGPPDSVSLVLRVRSPGEADYKPFDVQDFPPQSQATPPGPPGHQVDKEQDDLAPRHRMQVGIDPNQKDETGVGDRQVAHDPKHSLPLGTDHMGSLNGLRRAAKLGMSARGGHPGRRFAPPYRCTGIGVGAGAGFHRQGFASRHRLIQQDGPSSKYTSAATHSRKPRLKAASVAWARPSWK